MKAAIYARKSKYSVTSDSVENQLELCKRLAISLGIDESNIFAEFSCCINKNA